MEKVFIGTEAVARGELTAHELRRWYRAIYRDVYVDRRCQPTLRDRTIGAWLWSKRQAVIAGVAASALHGANWVDPDVPVELVFRSSRPHPGLLVRNERLAEDEVTWACRLPVTTRARTAFDLGRYSSRAQAVAQLDALMRSMPFSTEDVLLLAKRHHRARGVKALREVLPLVDVGAASPRETRLRLLFIDAGLPRPTTQIPICDHCGRLIRMVDMGWEEFMVAAEYDGDQHRPSAIRQGSSGAAEAGSHGLAGHQGDQRRPRRRHRRLRPGGIDRPRMETVEGDHEIDGSVPDTRTSARCRRSHIQRGAARRSRRNCSTSGRSSGGSGPTTWVRR